MSDRLVDIEITLFNGGGTVTIRSTFTEYCQLSAAWHKLKTLEGTHIKPFVMQKANASFHLVDVALIQLFEVLND